MSPFRLISSYLPHCLASYELYYQSKDRLFIFATEADMPLLGRIRIPNNATILFREDHPELEGTTDFSQTHYLKLVAFQVVTTEYFCVIDSDFLFIRPTSDHDLLRDGKPVWFYCASHNDGVPPKRRRACEAFVKQPIAYSYSPAIAPQYVFKRSIAAHSASRFSLTNFFNQDEIKDCLLYGSFALQEHEKEYAFIRSDERGARTIAAAVDQVPPDYCHLDPNCTDNQFKNYNVI